MLSGLMSRDCVNPAGFMSCVAMTRCQKVVRRISNLCGKLTFLYEGGLGLRIVVHNDPLVKL